MSNHLPDKHPDELFKYREFDKDEYGISIVREKHVYFSHVSGFNDPFDCFIPLSFDQLTEEEFDERAISALHFVQITRKMQICYLLTSPARCPLLNVSTSIIPK
jgi:hypothetical protein